MVARRIATSPIRSAWIIALLAVLLPAAQAQHARKLYDSVQGLKRIYHFADGMAREAARPFDRENEVPEKDWQLKQGTMAQLDQLKSELKNFELPPEPVGTGSWGALATAAGLEQLDDRVQAGRQQLDELTRTRDALEELRRTARATSRAAQELKRAVEKAYGPSYGIARHPLEKAWLDLTKAIPRMGAIARLAEKRRKLVEKALERRTKRLEKLAGNLALLRRMHAQAAREGVTEFPLEGQWERSDARGEGIIYKLEGSEGIMLARLPQSFLDGGFTPGMVTIRNIVKTDTNSYSCEIMSRWEQRGTLKEWGKATLTVSEDGLAGGGITWRRR